MKKALGGWALNAKVFHKTHHPGFPGSGFLSDWERGVVLVILYLVILY